MHIVEENENYIVVESLSSNGAKYCIGYPKASGYNSETLIEEIMKFSQDFDNSDFEKNWCKVDWIQDHDSQTSRKAINKGIVGGYVDISEKFDKYRYRINFSNHKGWSFSFKDYSTDIYNCVTIRNGNHYIDFNSASPSIVGVV